MDIMIETNIVAGVESIIVLLDLMVRTVSAVLSISRHIIEPTNGTLPQLPGIPDLKLRADCSSNDGFMQCG